MKHILHRPRWHRRVVPMEIPLVDHVERRREDFLQQLRLLSRAAFTAGVSSDCVSSAIKRRLDPRRHARFGGHATMVAANTLATAIPQRNRLDRAEIRAVVPAKDRRTDSDGPFMSLAESSIRRHVGCSFIGLALLAKDRPYDFTRDIGQSEIPSLVPVGQSQVVDAQ